MRCASSKRHNIHQREQPGGRYKYNHTAYRSERAEAAHPSTQTQTDTRSAHICYNVWQRKVSINNLNQQINTEDVCEEPKLSVPRWCPSQFNKKSVWKCFGLGWQAVYDFFAKVHCTADSCQHVCLVKPLTGLVNTAPQFNANNSKHC